MKVSVVIETVTARFDAPPAELPESLAPAIAAVEAQTYRDFEILVVIDDEVSGETADALRRRYPAVRLVHASAANYFAAKNAGARAAEGEIVALLDGDCVPDAEWLAVLVSRFTPGVSVVAGRTRYSGDSFVARTFSVPDFANVLAMHGDAATGFNLNNAGFRREALLAYPLDERIRRNGGCYLLYHTMREAGLRIVYEPRALAVHGLDILGLGFVKKHYDRGYDGVGVYRADERAVLKGTRLFRRFGRPALAAFTGRRIVLDWIRLAKYRRQIGISVVALPYYCTVAVGTRLIELAGGFKAASAR